MLSFQYNGEELFSWDVERSGAGEQDYVLVLTKLAKIGSIRRFVSRELMEGTQYTNVMTKELAAVIFAAFAHPSLRYVQRSVVRPLWAEWLQLREAQKNPPKVGQFLSSSR